MKAGIDGGCRCKAVSCTSDRLAEQRTVCRGRICQGAGVGGTVLYGVKAGTASGNARFACQSGPSEPSSIPQYSVGR